jgi:hypothetical protein
LTCCSLQNREKNLPPVIREEKQSCFFLIIP